MLSISSLLDHRFEEQWVSIKNIEMEAEYTFHFNDDLIDLSRDRQEVIQEIFQIIERDIPKASSIVFNINALRSSFFLDYFIPSLVQHTATGSNQTALEVLFQNVSSLRFEISFHCLVSYTDKQLLNVDIGFLNTLEHCLNTLPALLRYCGRIVSASRALKGLHFHADASWLVSLQRAERQLSLGADPGAPFLVKQAFSLVLEQLNQLCVCFFYATREQLPRLETLSLIFHSLHFKRVFHDEIIAQQININNDLITEADYLKALLSLASGLKDFEIRHHSLCQSAHVDDDLNLTHLYDVFRNWKSANNNNSSLERVRIEMNIYQQLWSFYSYLSTDFSLKKLSLRLNNKMKTEEEARLFESESYRQDLLHFAESIRSNKSITALTLITNIPHFEKNETDALRLTKMLAQNMIFNSLKLCIENNIKTSTKKIKWKIQVISLFDKHPTLKSLNLFGKTEKILAECPPKAGLEKDLFILHQAVQQSIQNNNRLLSQAPLMLQPLQASSRNIVIEANPMISPSQVLLESYRTTQLIALGYNYSRLLQQSALSDGRWQLYQQQQLCYFLLQIPCVNNRAPRFFDACSLIQQYLSPACLDAIADVTGGVFYQLHKKSIPQHVDCCLLDKKPKLLLSIPSDDQFFDIILNDKKDTGRSRTRSSSLQL